MIAEDVVEAALFFLLDSVTAIGAVLSSIWSVIYIFLFGWLGIQARTLFLYLIPTLIVLAKPIVFLINIMLDFIVGFADVFVLIVDAIADFLNTIQSAIPGLDLGIHFPDFFKPLAWPPDQLTDAEFINTLRDIGSTCPPFDSLGKIVEYLFTLAIGDRTCVLVRYIWPLPRIYDITEAIFSWTYAGGSLPYPDVDGENCDKAVTVGTHELICVGVGFGYVVLDLLLPLLLVGILINAYIPFISTLARLIGQVIGIGIDYTVKAAERVAEIIGKF